MDYTRSFWRRIGAFVADAVLANLVVVLVFGWWAMSLDAPVRFGDGLVHSETCTAGAAFVMPSVPISTEDWDKVRICDTVSDFVFPSKKLALDRVTSSGAGNKTTVGLTIPLNSKNVVTTPFSLDHIWFLVWLVGVSLFEASRKQASPGKRLLGLEVKDVNGNRATFLQCFIRNALKLVYLVPLSLYVFYLFWLSDPMMGIIKPGDPHVYFSNQMGYALVVGAILALINFVILASVVFPFKNMGRGLYDRIAGTKVVLP